MNATAASLLMSRFMSGFVVSETGLHLNLWGLSLVLATFAVLQSCRVREPAGLVGDGVKSGVVEFAPKGEEWCRLELIGEFAYFEIAQPVVRIGSGEYAGKALDIMVRRLFDGREVVVLYCRTEPMGTYFELVMGDSPGIIWLRSFRYGADFGDVARSPYASLTDVQGRLRGGSGGLLLIEGRRVKSSSYPPEDFFIGIPRSPDVESALFLGM